MKAVLTPPAPVASSSCSSCGRRIVWAVTQKGKRMPVDFERDDNGNLILYADSFDKVSFEPKPPYRVKMATPEEREILGTKLWVSHFATCPQAAQHRRPGSPSDATTPKG